MKTPLPTLGLLLLIVVLGGCASQSQSYADNQSGYSMIRGRITRIENLSASEVQKLSDGIAVTVDKPGCKLRMTFGDNQSSEMELAAGAIIVYGLTEDYILQAAPGLPPR